MSSFLKTARVTLENKDTIVQNRYETWLAQNSDFYVPPELEATLLRLCRPSKNSVRHGRFGASSRGSCERKQVFKFLGMPELDLIGAQLSNIFRNGTMVHIRTQLALLQADIATHVEIGSKKKKHRLSTSVDALNRDEGWLLELKGLAHVPSEIPDNHALQMSTYWITFPEYDTFVYLVESKQFQTLHERTFKKDPKLVHIVEQEIGRLNDAIDSKTLPEVLRECESGTGADFRKCEFHHQCLQQESWPVKSEDITGTHVWITESSDDEQFEF